MSKPYTPVDITLPATVAAVEYRTYPQRWVLLTAIFLLNVSSSVLWITYSAVSGYAAAYFHQSLFAINQLSAVYYVMYILFSLTASWVIHEKGLLQGLAAGGILTIAGAWLRYFSAVAAIAPVYRFYMVAAAGQPFLLNAPTKFAAAWFPTTSRGSANTVATISSPLGFAVGMLVVPALCTNAEQLPHTLMIIAAAVTVPVLVLPFLRSAPPTPPGPALVETPKPFFASLKDAFRARGFPALVWTFASFVGVFTAFGALMTDIVNPYGYSNEDAGMLGALTIIGGLLGAVVMGPLIDHTGWHVELLKGLIPISAGSFISMLWIVKADSFLLLGALCFAMGLTTFSLLPAALELGAECAYPVAGGTTAGILWMSSNAAAVVIQMIMNTLRAPDTADPPYNMENAVAFAGSVAGLAAIVGVCGFRGRLRRRMAENVALEDKQ